jgi:hypothetical protein
MCNHHLGKPHHSKNKEKLDQEKYRDGNDQQRRKRSKEDHERNDGEERLTGKC